MSQWQVKLFYDGKCPFCRREVAWLKRCDKHGYLALEDISDPAVDPAQYGLTAAEVSAALHGVLPGGQVVRGIDAVRQACQAVGLGWFAAPLGWPGLRWIADRLYHLYARNRLRLVCPRRAAVGSAWRAHED
jgi:predicted DCC family thiol-disulfide oxidoreductase YuxK